MESSLDSVDNIPFQTPDQVKPVQQSEKDKQRKFYGALKEQMEEELHKGRKEYRQDEFVQDEDNRQTSGQQATGSKPPGRENKSDVEPENDTTHQDSPSDTHVDLKA